MNHLQTYSCFKSTYKYDWPAGGDPPIVCVVLPGGEASLTALLLRLVLGVPGAAYFFVDAGPFGSGGQPEKTEVE